VFKLIRHAVRSFSVQIYVFIVAVSLVLVRTKHWPCLLAASIETLDFGVPGKYELTHQSTNLENCD